MRRAPQRKRPQALFPSEVPVMSLRRRQPLTLLAAMAFAVMLAALSATATLATSAKYPDAEQYALTLLNCVRTGGWVRANGDCIADGGANHSKSRKPLIFSERLASEISRPQARRLARAGYLDHNLGGSISTRFLHAGISCCAYGENLGHYIKPIADAVVAIHRMMQAEKPYRGPHWENFKDKRYKYVGIAVWTRGRDVYVAYDFWDGRTHW